MRSNALAQNGHSCCPRPVGGLGFAKVVSNPKFPEHEFFRAGRVFCLRLRHNNLAFEDDAMLDGRVTCIKVSGLLRGAENWVNGAGLVNHKLSMVKYWSHNYNQHEKFVLRITCL